MFSRWRARKKKALINLPFVNRTIRKVPSNPRNYKQNEVSLPTVQEQKAKSSDRQEELNTPLSQEQQLQKTKEVKTVSADRQVMPVGRQEDTSPVQLINPANLVLSNSISINAKTLNQEKEKTENEATQVIRPTKDYTAAEFELEWNNYKTKLHQKGKISLATVFEEIPQINNHTIDLMVENKALQDEFNHHKADFLDFIREALNNYNIQVTTQINKEFKTKKAYTPQEKYEKMREKNPALDLLKKKLDMEVGYS